MRVCSGFQSLTQLSPHLTLLFRIHGAIHRTVKRLRKFFKIRKCSNNPEITKKIPVVKACMLFMISLKSPAHCILLVVISHSLAGFVLNMDEVSSKTGLPIFYLRFNHYALQKLSQAEPTGLRKCKDNLPQEFRDWQTKFYHIYQSSKGHKLKQFLFKLLHRIIVTKKELYNVWNSQLVIDCTDKSLMTLISHRYNLVATKTIPNRK